MSVPSEKASLYQPGVAPSMGQPHMGQPHMGQPHMGQPHMGQPHMGQPHMGQPHMGQPHMGQPHMGQPVVVQHTSVNIHQEMPQDYIIWSLCSLLYCNPFCLGLVALINSVKSRDRKMVGDVEGSRSHGASARRFNIAAAVLTSIFGLIGFIILIVRYREAAHA